MTRASIAIALSGMLAAASVLMPVAAIAGEEDVVVAAETFRAGEAAYSRGDFEAAARSFEVSHRLAPHSIAAYNAGLAWAAANQHERAADSFNVALTMGGLGETQQADATTRLDALKATLGMATLTAPEGTLLWIAHLERAAPPTNVHLKPGKHELKVLYADGASETRTLAIEAGKVTTMDLVVKPAAAPADPKQPKPDETSSDTGDDDGTAMIAGGIVALGVGTLMAGAAIGMGVAALGARDDFEASGNTDADAHDKADTLRTATNVSWVVAGLLGATGVILIIAAPSDDAPAPGESATQVSLRLAPTSLAATVRF